MNSPFSDISIVLSCAVLALESSVLMACLDELVTLRKRLEGAATVDATHRLISRKLPSFRAELLEPSVTLSSEDLRGNSSMLLFVDPESVLTMVPAELETAAHFLLHKIDGYLYVFCGNRAQCRRFRRAGVLPETYWARTRLVLDPRTTFGIRLEWPQPGLLC